MSSFLAQLSGHKGCGRQSGAGTYTPSGIHAGKKIVAIGVEADAEITNYKFTPETSGASEQTVTSEDWMGVTLAASGATAYIPIGRKVNSVTVASGDIMIYFG